MVLLMDEILHHFYHAGHPFQTLNLNIAVLAMLRKYMCVNDRNPASPICARNVEIEGCGELDCQPSHTCNVGGHARFCPSTVSDKISN